MRWERAVLGVGAAVVLAGCNDQEATPLSTSIPRALALAAPALLLAAWLTRAIVRRWGARSGPGSAHRAAAAAPFVLVGYLLVLVCLVQAWVVAFAFREDTVRMLDWDTESLLGVVFDVLAVVATLAFALLADQIWRGRPVGRAIGLVLGLVLGVASLADLVQGPPGWDLVLFAAIGLGTAALIATLPVPEPVPPERTPSDQRDLHAPATHSGSGSGGFR